MAEVNDPRRAVRESVPAPMWVEFADAAALGLDTYAVRSPNGGLQLSPFLESFKFLAKLVLGCINTDF